MTPPAPTTVAPIVPDLGDAALRDAVRTLAHVRMQTTQESGDVRRRGRDEGGALEGAAGAAVAREVAAFAGAARRLGAPVSEVLVAVAAAVRAAGAPMPIGPREAVVRDASRCCVKAFYEARATAPAEAGRDG